MGSFVEPTIRRTSGKQRLITAANKLFSRGSYDDVSVAAILDESGLKAPSLYHHFGDKEGLYVAWVQTAIRATESAIAEAVSDQGPQSNLNAIAAVLTKSTPLDILQIGKDLETLKNPDFTQQVTQMIAESIVEPVSRVIATAQETGLFPPGDLQELTRLFLHSTMFSHPNYSGVNGELSSLGSSTHEVIVAWFCGNLSRSA